MGLGWAVAGGMGPAMGGRCMGGQWAAAANGAVMGAGMGGGGHGWHGRRRAMGWHGNDVGAPPNADAFLGKKKKKATERS